MLSSPTNGARKHAFLEAAFASVPNAIVIVDSAGVCIEANPAFEALFGYGLSEVVGCELVDLIVPEAGREAALRLQERVRNGETLVTETERRRKDGAAVTVRISVARVEREAEAGVLFLYTDVTETRRAEEAARAAQARLQQVLASSTAVIYATRVEGEAFTPSWVSENLTRITGYEVSEALHPDWWFDHLHPDDRSDVLAALPRLLSEGSLTIEYRFQVKQGPYCWIRDESRLVRDAEGQPLEVFGAWLDITDLKRAAQTMEEARHLAERSARARSEFLANMSHEIRTPMNAVLGLTEIVLDTELAPDQRRSLRLVQQAGETLLTLLNDILDLSKIEAEHLALESVPFDLRYLLESTASLLSVRVADRPIELVADVGSSMPHLVRGDPTRLRQVLTNLLGNAIKFTKQGEVVLSAQAEALPDGQSRIRLAVRDTGIGIPSAKLETIFEDFTQADASMTRNYGGTGLGLGIARRLVGLMGGKLTVVSEEGRGSEFGFTVTLPVEEAGALAAPTVARIAGHRMLVVDDNATNRRIVHEMLVAADVIVDEAASADEAIEALRRAGGNGQPYKLAIIDAQMPERDGFQLAAGIRSDSALAGTLLLMLTSAGQRGDSQRCREVGIDGYLMKPISRSELLEATGVLIAAAGRPSRGELVTHHSMAESRRHLRILLAEDNAVNQEVAAALLRKRGHLVDIVNNGRLAVEKVIVGSYDLVLMDIQMPEMDGLAATQAIRAGAANADIPILALTAHALTGERERCLAHGMNGYVPKPFRPHELFAAVESIGADPPAAVVDAAAAVASAPPVDLEGFRSAMREADAEDAVDGILEVFVEGAPQRLAAVAEAVTAGDGDAIGRAAHAFKSAAGSIGAHGLAELLRELELIGNAGSLDQARPVCDRVQRETDVVLGYLCSERGGKNGKG
jgi:two-component system sensor histidine kinase/response regulator